MLGLVEIPTPKFFITEIFLGEKTVNGDQRPAASEAVLIYYLITNLEPEVKVIPLAAIDGAVERCSLPSVDLHTLYGQEVRRVH